MRFLKVACLLSTIGLSMTSEASLLWNNGDHDDVGSGVNNEYQSVMDDFYVPGAGWKVSSAETHGIFLNPGRHVAEVDVNIWPADFATGEPDGDDVNNLKNTSFTVEDTGESWEGYNKLKVSIDFESTFLSGSRYYWIELDIKDQYGHRLKLLERQEINFNDAHLRSNPYPYASGVDLAYRLSGTPIVTIGSDGTDDFKPEGLDSGYETVTLQIAGVNKRLDPGYYQIQLLRNNPELYLFDRYGKHRVEFTSNPKAPTRLSTPIGDDMCKNTSGSLHDFCQSFVACAAYDLFCPGL